MPLLGEVGKCWSGYNLRQYGAQTNAEKFCECPITRNKYVPSWPQTSNNSSPVRFTGRGAEADVAPTVQCRLIARISRM